MNVNETKFDSSQLYFIEPDGSATTLCHIDDIVCRDDSVDISDAVTNMRILEASFTAVTKSTKDIMLAITGMYQAVIGCCPDKRVVHLALHGKKARTRKKNRNRAFRILEEN